jgi:hypothetical protein
VRQILLRVPLRPGFPPCPAGGPSRACGGSYPSCVVGVRYPAGTMRSMTGSWNCSHQTCERTERAERSTEDGAHRLVRVSLLREAAVQSRVSCFVFRRGDPGGRGCVSPVDRWLTPVSAIRLARPKRSGRRQPSRTRPVGCTFVSIFGTPRGRDPSLTASRSSLRFYRPSVYSSNPSGSPRCLIPVRSSISNR